MIFAMALLVPAFVVILWAYFKYSPSSEEHESVATFNTISIVLALVGAGAYVFYVYVTMARGPDAHWWPSVAGIFSIALIALVLGISAFVRKLVYSRTRTPSDRKSAD